MLAEIVEHSAVGHESFKGETCIYRYHLIFKHSLPEAGQAQHSFAKTLYRSTSSHANLPQVR